MITSDVVLNVWAYLSIKDNVVSVVGVVFCLMFIRGGKQGQAYWVLTDHYL